MGEKIGLQVLKREANSSPQITPSDINTIGLLLDVDRGPIGKPVLVTNLTDAKVVFGGPNVDRFGYYVLKGLFDNCKEYGAKVYGVRVAGTTTPGVASTVTVNETTTPLFDLTAAYKGAEDPGAWGDDLQVVVAVNETTGAFSLTVLLNSVEVESWVDLTLETLEAKLNHPITGSRYILADLTVADFIHTPDAGTVSLTGGTDPSDAIISNWEDFEPLDSVPVDVVAVAGPFQGDEITAALDLYCAGRGDCIGVSCSEFTEDPDTVMVTMNAGGQTAPYLGWIEVDDGLGSTIWVPPIGHVIGAAYIRKVMAKGGYPHIAPAGYLTYLRGALNIQFPTIDALKLEVMVHSWGVNAIMHVPNAGFIVRTSRSTNTQPKYYSIHALRLANYIAKSFKNSLGWVEQEANTPETRGRLRDSITFFMNALRNAGAFDQQGSCGENGYIVKCDEENNPPEVRNARQLVCDVLFDPVEIAETVKINLFNAKGLKVTVE